MVRWRLSLVLAMMLLLLLPPRVSCKGDDEDEEERNEDADDEEDEDDEDDEEESNERASPVAAARRAPPHHDMAVAPKTLPVTRTSKKRPLECYVCAYKAETPLKACLDPTRFRYCLVILLVTSPHEQERGHRRIGTKLLGNAYNAENPLEICLNPNGSRVHTITCHSVDDKCFTTVISKGVAGYEAVIRGCRSGCVGSPDTNCCELNRCNNQAFALPAPQVLTASNKKANKPGAPNVLYFVTILLLLQTVAKVAYL